MDISIESVAAQIINFAILFFVYKKYVAQHVSDIIEEKKELMYKLSHAQEQYDEQLQEATDKAEAIYAEALSEKTRIISEAGNLGKQKQDTIIAKAEQDAQNILTQAQQKAQKLEDDLSKNFVKSVKTTASAVVRKLINKDTDIKESYVQEMMSDVQKAS